MEPESQSDPSIENNINAPFKNTNKKRSFDEHFDLGDVQSRSKTNRSIFSSTPSSDMNSTDISTNRSPTICTNIADHLDHSKQGCASLALIFPSHKIPSNFSPKDEFICNNVEMFVPTNEDGVQTQLGFRCIHCARRDKTTVDHCIIFPSSIEEMENSLNLMIERHFPKCPSLPESVQRSFLGLKLNHSEKKSSNSKLREFLIQYCKNANIVNRAPYQTGVISGSKQSRDKDVDIPSTSYYHSPKYNTLEQYPPPQSQTLGGSFDHSLIDQYSTPSSQPYKYQKTAHFPTPCPQVGHQQQPIYNLPFIQTDHNTWECRYCLNQAIEVRAERSIWYASSPPDTMFMEHHLRMCSGRLAYPTHSCEINMFQYNQHHVQQSYPPPPRRQPQFHPMNYQLGMPSSTFAQGMNIPSKHSNYNHGSLPQNTFQWRIPPGPMDSSSIHTSQNYTLWNAKAILQKEELRYNNNHNNTTNNTSLIQEQDKPLITDYFCYIMKQLRICNFMEKDRATRGGKRTNIKVGYGGLECIHCSLTSSPRKFFWSDVNRLSNSFAEIPTHVLRCSSCPDVVKKALLTLKEFHPLQMAEKQRGSQKTYLRRVWKRIHCDDNGSHVGKSSSTSSTQGVQSSPESAIPGLDSIDSLGSDSPENGVSGASLTSNKTTTMTTTTTMTRGEKLVAPRNVIKGSNLATPDTKLPDLPKPRIL